MEEKWRETNIIISELTHLTGILTRIARAILVIIHIILVAMWKFTRMQRLHTEKS